LLLWYVKRIVDLPIKKEYKLRRC